jgi:hypothetical protein
MFKVIHLADDGTEVAAVELDDFTIEVIYAGLAEMLREAESVPDAPAASEGDLPRAERQRREKILTRIRS